MKLLLLGDRCLALHTSARATLRGCGIVSYISKTTPASCNKVSVSPGLALQASSLSFS